MSIVSPDPTMDNGATNTETRERSVARWSTRGLLTVLGFGLLMLALIIFAARQAGFGGQVGTTTFDTTGASGGATDPRAGTTVGGTGGQPGETGFGASVPGSTGSGTMGSGAATGAGSGAVNPVGGGTSGNTSGGTTSGVPAGGSGTAGGFGGGR